MSADENILATADDLAAINAARTALDAIKSRTMRAQEYGVGVVYGKADAASAALVSTLSSLRHWGEVEFSDAIMFNRTEAPA